MQFKFHDKAITFLGLFFLVSISLHSFAHVSDTIFDTKPQIACQSCKNKNSPSIETITLVFEEVISEPSAFTITQTFYLKLQKSFYSQAPPKI